MTADKRKITTDALETLGNIIGEAEGRDAIHLAVEPVTATHTLRPGEHVGFVEGGVGVCEKPVGIVDPFLKAPVQKGQRFWLIVYPRQITSLRHVWTHPAFADHQTAAPTDTGSDLRIRSEKWIRDFCEMADCPGYEAVMAKAAEIADGGSGSDWDDDYMFFDGLDAHGEIPDVFWTHAAVVLGREIRGPKAKYFSCSC